MPIGGVVIATRPEDLTTALEQLAPLQGMEVHGTDERGHIIAVFDTRTGEEMERLMEAVNACPAVLHAGLTYLNMEDAVEPDAVNGSSRSGDVGA